MKHQISGLLEFLKTVSILSLSSHLIHDLCHDREIKQSEWIFCTCFPAFDWWNQWRKPFTCKILGFVMFLLVRRKAASPSYFCALHSEFFIYARRSERKAALYYYKHQEFYRPSLGLFSIILGQNVDADGLMPTTLT